MPAFADQRPIELAQANVIGAIEVRGAQRVDPGTVRSYMVISRRLIRRAANRPFA